ncbi:MAG: hypothetical protein AAGF30_08390 [Pseudomonadota bacterium]
MFRWLRGDRRERPGKPVPLIHFSGEPEDLPLLLPGDGRRLFSLYGPLNDLGAFVGQLQILGVPRDKLPHDFRSLAALESYCGSIEGEGHALFRDNNGQLADTIVQDAIRGCHVLGFSDLRQIIEDFVAVLEEDTRWKGIVPNEDRISRINGTYEALDKRLYGLKLSDAEAAEIPSLLPAPFREQATALLAKPDFYSSNPYYVRGMVWVLNAPALTWYTGPGYWDQVRHLAKLLSSSSSER